MYVVDASLDDGYRAMAAGNLSETEAIEWCNGLARGMANGTQ